MKLEDLHPHSEVLGLPGHGAVTVVSVHWLGADALNLIYRTPDGRVAKEVLDRTDEIRLELLENGTATPCEGWDRPARLDQLGLFSEPRDRFLALAGISIDDLERWRHLGWISFDVRELTGIDEGRAAEICFVRNLARSGLGDLQVHRILGRLKRPYRYDPSRIAYSFGHGWVQLPPQPSSDQCDEFLEHHLEEWIERKAVLGELSLLRRISYKLIRAITERHDSNADAEDLD